MEGEVIGDWLSSVSFSASIPLAMYILGSCFVLYMEGMVAVVTVGPGV